MQAQRIFISVLLCVLAAGLGACKRSDAPEAAAPAATAATTATKFDKLLGRWARTDGEYTLELRAVDAAGKLTAGYLNPSVINIEKAEASTEGDRLMVFVVLRDVNYPGCTYKLAFDKEHDALVGVYFQAMQQQTYEVAFTRLK